MAPTIRVRVASTLDAAARIRLYELVPVVGDLPPFTAGAHVTVRLPSGTERQYSLCNDPAEANRYVIGVLRCDDGRGGSREMHAAVAAGVELLIGAPANNFPLAPEATASLLVAGGIGATPILAMARVLARAGHDFRLVYLSRSPVETAFLDDLAGPAFAGRVTVHHDEGRADRQADLAALLGPAAPGRHLYCCGPAGLMAAVAGAAADWPAGHVHFEHFTNEIAAEQAGDRPFTVRLAGRGGSYVVPPGRTILEVLLEAGLDIDYSCGEGTCGTCITRLLAGVADHRDAVLTDAEKAAGDSITICCSRAKTPELVLDL